MLLYAGLLLGGLLIFRLAARYEDLADAYSQMVQRLQWPHAGYSVPTFTNVTIDGEPVTLGARDEGRQLVFFFSTTCPYCLASLPAWKRIGDVGSRENGDLEVLGVAIDGDGEIGEYRDDHGLVFPITTFPDTKLQLLYRATNVPLVVLFDQSGRVLYSRVGALDEPSAVDSVLLAVRDLRSPTEQ